MYVIVWRSQTLYPTATRGKGLGTITYLGCSRASPTILGGVLLLQTFKKMFGCHKESTQDNFPTHKHFAIKLQQPDSKKKNTSILYLYCKGTAMLQSHSQQTNQFSLFKDSFSRLDIF